MRLPTAIAPRSTIGWPLRTKSGMRQTINSPRSRMAVHWKGVSLRRSIDRPIGHPSVPLQVLNPHCRMGSRAQGSGQDQIWIL